MNKRRARASAARSRSPEHNQQGVYSNQHFTTTAAGFVGCNSQVDTTDGNSYSGIYSAFSSQFEVVLEYAQLVDGPEAAGNGSLRRMIIDPKNIVNMSFKNVDPKYATRDGGFQTDSCISKYERNGQVSLGEKELQPWISDCNGEEIDLTLSTEPGWDANAMFKINEEMYGVRSSFDHSLVGYTTTIERSDSKGFKEAEARAARIANEIERNTKSQAQAELENGDEEERFAAVSRPLEGESNSPPRSQLPQDKKYINPARRAATGYQGTQGRPSPRSAPYPPGHPSAPSNINVEEHHERNERIERRDVDGSPATQVPTGISEDNRNNNNCSPSTAPVISPQPLPPHSRPSNSNNNNSNTGRGKPYGNIMQPGYPYSPQPRYPGAVHPSHPTLVQHRPMVPTSHQPPSAPAIQHGPPPTPVYTQQLPPNHAPGMPSGPVPVIPQEVPMQVQQVIPTHGMDGPGMTHVHMPPHGVHPVPVPLPAGYVHAPPHNQEQDMRGAHRNPGIRGQSPRLFPPKRFTTPPFQPAPVRGKTRSDEVNELSEFSSNLKLAPAEQDPEMEEKQGSPPLEQWNKGRSPPSNGSSEDAATTLKKSTLNPNAKEFVYNPSAKPFTPRPANTPGPSRPHTPHTPAQPFGFSPGPVPTVIMPTYVMQPAYSHQATPQRLQMAPRPDISTSQMQQVAAATGQPLLAPAPIQRFVAPYPNPPPQPGYPQMVRMVPGQGPVLFQEGAHHLQYMSPHGQPHPAGQFQHAQPQQFPSLVYSVPVAQSMMPYFQQPPQPGQQAQHVQLIVPNQ